MDYNEAEELLIKQIIRCDKGELKTNSVMMDIKRLKLPDGRFAIVSIKIEARS